MARLTVPGFSGVVKITAPQRLEDHQAQYALDSDFRSGDLRPYHGDDASEYSAGPGTDPSSLYLYDQGQLIKASGEVTFARSPVFFLESGNDKRVFFSNSAASGDYPKVLTAFPSGGALPGDAKRLGVPQPGEVKIDNVEVVVREGLVARIDRYANADTDILIDAASAAVLENGDKVLLDVPGIAAKVYTLSKAMDFGDGTKQFTLTGTKMARTKVKVTYKKTDDGVTLTKLGHNFVPGDQVVIWRGVGQTYSKLNASYTTKLFSVQDGATADSFILVDSAGNQLTPSNTNANITADDDFFINVYLAAPADSALPTTDPSNTSSGRLTVDVPNAGTHVGFQFSVPDAVTHTWEDAASADVAADRSYCVTFINAFGDESEPSLPTKPVSVVPGSPVTFKAGSLPVVSSKADTPVGSYLPIQEIRLYRTDALGTFRLVTTDSMGAGTNKILFSDASGASFTYEDKALDSVLGEPLATAGWSVPARGMIGLVNAPNGVVAGFRGRTIFGSVAYAPYAWPISHQVATEYDVVGLVPTSAGLVVVTKGTPYILIGDNPANWSMQKLEYPQGCVSSRSIVDMGEFAMYASPDGLVAVAGANVELLTKSVMTREQWQAYQPSTIVAGQAEGRYIATYGSGSGRKGFIYDPQTQSFTDLTLNSVAFCNDLLNDVLLTMSPGSGAILKWNQATTTFKPYHWVSKWFQLPIPEIMGVAQIFTTTIDLTGRDLTFILHGYDNNGATKLYEISTASNPDAILGNRPFRLPYVAPGRFSAFQATLKGSIPVGTVMIGRTMDELKEAP